MENHNELSNYVVSQFFNLLMKDLKEDEGSQYPVETGLREAAEP
jgi:hypothetical protein